MEPDDQNEAFHRFQRQLHETCLAGDNTRLHQLAAHAELDAVDATDTSRSSEGYLLATMRDLIRGADVDQAAPCRRTPWCRHLFDTTDFVDRWCGCRLVVTHREAP